MDERSERAEPRSREHALVVALCVAAPLALLALGLLLEPDPRGFGTHEQLGFEPCLPMARWSVPCPGCGVTTSVALAAHGHPLAALRAQPVGIALLVLALAAAVWALAAHARGRDLARELPHVAWKPLLWTLGLLVALGWLYKLAAVRGWLG